MNTYESIARVRTMASQLQEETAGVSLREFGLAVADALEHVAAEMRAGFHINKTGNDATQESLSQVVAELKALRADLAKLIGST